MRRLGNVVTLLAIIGCGAMAQQASAATINVACGDVTGLRNAITDANATAGADTIEIADASPCTFSLNGAPRRPHRRRDRPADRHRAADGQRPRRDDRTQRRRPPRPPASWRSPTRSSCSTACPSAAAAA